VIPVAVREISIPDNEIAPRVETGAVQFGKDWPGLFVRGDQALHLAWCIGALEPILKQILEKHPDVLPGENSWDRVDMALGALSLIRRIINEEVRVS
jgi:hypothetical protein